MLLLLALVLVLPPLLVLLLLQLPLLLPAATTTISNSAVDANTSKFSSAWLCQQTSWNRQCQQTSWNRNLSVVRSPCRIYLRTYWADSFQISVVASPGPYPQTFCLKNFWGKCISGFFFSFSLTYDAMGSKTSKRYSSLKSLLNFFWIFLSVVLTKVLFLDFWNFELLIFHYFFRVNMGPYGSSLQKATPSLISLLNFSKLFLNFLLSSPHKTTVLDFENFEFTILNFFSQI